MKKLEPGMLCRVVGVKESKNFGKIVKLARFVGTPPRIEGLSDNWGDSSWWELSDNLVIKSGLGGRVLAPYAPTENLQPISPDHQPADEQWQEDFKRMLNGEKLRVKL